jgi:hypothetical protein
MRRASAGAAATAGAAAAGLQVPKSPGLRSRQGLGMADGGGGGGRGGGGGAGACCGRHERARPTLPRRPRVVPTAALASRRRSQPGGAGTGAGAGAALLPAVVGVGMGRGGRWASALAAPGFTLHPCSPAAAKSALTRSETAAPLFDPSPGQHSLQLFRDPPTIIHIYPTSTKMASGAAVRGGGRGDIKTTAAPGTNSNPESMSPQQPQVLSPSKKALSSYISTAVHRPAQFLTRPTKNSGTATGTTTPTSQKRTMVSMVPTSVNRTSLHPHGVQYVLSLCLHPPTLRALFEESLSAKEPLPDVTLL